MRRFRAAIAPPPLGQCYCYCVRYRPAPHLLCGAALPPACSLLLVQTLFCTRLPHVPITLLGSGFFKRRQTTDAAARTRASPFPSPYFDFSFGKKNRHVVVEARKTTIFAHLPSIGLYLSRRPRPMLPPPHGKQPAALCAADDV